VTGFWSPVHKVGVVLIADTQGGVSRLDRVPCCVADHNGRAGGDHTLLGRFIQDVPVRTRTLGDARTSLGARGEGWTLAAVIGFLVEVRVAQARLTNSARIQKETRLGAGAGREVVRGGSGGVCGTGGALESPADKLVLGTLKESSGRLVHHALARIGDAWRVASNARQTIRGVIR